jgi:dCMP deaminase
MFIGLCGGICAGKQTVAQYLVDHHGFQELHLQRAESDSPRGQHTFQTAHDLVEFVTLHWQERWVTTDIYNEAILDIIVRRPFFILISVDAPVSVRWKRFQKKLNDASGSTSSLSKDLTLEEFLLRSDEHLYSPSTGLLPLISRATVRLLNTSSHLAHLYASLGKLDLTNEDRLRPNWDQYFMELASLAAQRSNCMKRRVGCVLVREKRVISTGYNGTPRGLRNCMEGGCSRCNEAEGSGVGLSTCLCIHAEENALLEAGRERIREGAILYCDTCPCLTCSIKIAQVGISEVVYSQSYSMDQATASVFKEAGVQLRQFSPVSSTEVCIIRFEAYCSIACKRSGSSREADIPVDAFRRSRQRVIAPPIGRRKVQTLGLLRHHRTSLLGREDDLRDGDGTAFRGTMSTSGPRAAL